MMILIHWNFLFNKQNITPKTSNNSFKYIHWNYFYLIILIRMIEEFFLSMKILNLLIEPLFVFVRL